MIEHFPKSFPQLPTQKVKEFIDSGIDNIEKAYDDLRDNKPDEINSAKLNL